MCNAKEFLGTECREGLILMCCGEQSFGSLCSARLAAALKPVVVDEEKLEVRFSFQRVFSH